MRAPIPAVILVLLVSPVFGQGLTQQSDYGESNGGFPSWEERVVHQLTNRARIDPAADLAGCPAGSCLEASCYSATAPVFWDYDLNQAARFHSASMGRFSFFAHDTPCQLFADINARFPGTSDGSFASSCSSSGTTSAGSRVTMFGAMYGGENIAAGYGSPHAAFYGWLYEQAGTNACGFTYQNGHRYNILTNRGPALGAGHAFVDGSPYRQYWTQDFGGAGSDSKIPSGTHWTTNRARDPGAGDSTVEFWANWFDVAGGAPVSATVVLDNVSRTMTRGRGTAANGAYSATVSNVGAGCHSYYFSFTDSSRNTVRYPSTGALGFGVGCADYQGGVTAPAAPTGVNAWATSSTQVQITWALVPGATSYSIYRRSSAGSFEPRGSSLTPSYTDAAAADTAYLYVVRAVNAGGASGDSAGDLATTVAFTTDSVVRAAHLRELRTAVTAVRQLTTPGSVTYTDSAAAGVIVKAVHIEQLRAYLDQTMGALGLTTGGWTDSTLASVGIKAAHFQQIRDRVR